MVPSASPSLHFHRSVKNNHITMDEPKTQAEEKIEDIIDDLWATMGQQPLEALSDDEDPFPYYESLSRDDEENAGTGQSTTPSSNDKTTTGSLSLEQEAPVSETAKIISETDKSSTKIETTVQVSLGEPTKEPIPQKSEETTNSGETSKQTDMSVDGPGSSRMVTLGEASISEQSAPEGDSAQTKHSALKSSATAASAEKSEPTEAAVPPDPPRPAAISGPAPEAIEGARHDASTSQAAPGRGQVQSRRASRPRISMPRVPPGVPSRANGAHHEVWQPNGQFASRPGSRYGYAVYPPIHYNSNVLHYPPAINFRASREENRTNRRRERSRNRVRYGPYY